MKRLSVFIAIILFTQTAFGQANPNPEYFIKMDSTYSPSSFSPEWKTAFFNQVVAIRDHNGQPLMLIMLPANGGHSPVPGTYPIMEGKKRTVKKGSQIAKLEFEPGYISTDDAGTLTITENEGVYFFKAENVSIVNSKTNEKHTINFKFGLFIEKK